MFCSIYNNSSSYNEIFLNIQVTGKCVENRGKEVCHGMYKNDDDTYHSRLRRKEWWGGKEEGDKKARGKKRA